MKKALSCAALALCFGFGIGSGAVIASGNKQDGFPDVPQEHWAYESVARLKSGGVIAGDVDGLFRGSRPATRYEVAVWLDGLYQKVLATQLTGELDKVSDGEAIAESDLALLDSEELGVLLDSSQQSNSKEDPMVVVGKAIVWLHERAKTCEVKLNLKTPGKPWK